MKYSKHHLGAHTLYTVDDFIDGNFFYTEKDKPNGQILLYAFLFPFFFVGCIEGVQC